MKHRTVLLARCFTCFSNYGQIQTKDYRIDSTGSLTGSSCTDDENNGQGNNIIYGENIIGNGEQTFEIKDHQYLKRGTYLMKGWCYVTYGSTLTIEAGTVIKGDKKPAPP